MARYMERAENMARLLEVGHRLAMLPKADGAAEWRSTLRSAGCEAAFVARHGAFERDAVVDFLLLDRSNPSSVQACLAAARRNARAQRAAITRDMWESLNGAWNDYSAHAHARMASNELPVLFDWIRERSALFRGALLNSILRNDTFHFSQLGTHIERADNTARILDVKYYVLLPRNEIVGGGLDSAQWAAILRAVSAHRSFRWVYPQAFKPWNIADFLILNPRMPRSLRACYNQIVPALDALRAEYGVDTPCQPAAAEVMRRLEAGDISGVFKHGLHEFLAEFIAANNALAFEIAQSHHFNE
jgi:uncharacterized alpha-E superfamily protein